MPKLKTSTVITPEMDRAAISLAEETHCGIEAAYLAVVDRQPNGAPLTTLGPVKVDKDKPYLHTDAVGGPGCRVTVARQA